MLPCVVISVLKHVLIVFIFQVDFVAGLEGHIRAICHFMRLSVQLFVAYGISEVLWLSQVLGNVRDEAHVLYIIVDEVVVLCAVLTPYRRQPLDYDMVVHVSLNAHRLAPIGKHVLFDHKFNIARFQLIEPIAKLVVKHLLAILLKEIEVAVLAAQEHGTVDFEQMLKHFTLVNFHA